MSQNAVKSLGIRAAFAWATGPIGLVIALIVLVTASWQSALLVVAATVVVLVAEIVLLVRSGYKKAKSGELMNDAENAMDKAISQLEKFM